MGLNEKLQPSSGITRFVLVIIPVLLVFGFIWLIQSQKAVTEVARIPKTALGYYTAGTIRPGTSDVILMGDAEEPEISNDESAGSRSDILVGTADESGSGTFNLKRSGTTTLLSISDTGHRKLFNIDGLSFHVDRQPASFTRDGRKMLIQFSSGNTPIGMTDMSEGKLLWKTSGGAWISESFKPLSNDGKHIVAFCTDSKPKGLWLFDAAIGKPLRHLVKSATPHSAFTIFGFSPVSNEVLYAESLPGAKSLTLHSVDIEGKKSKVIGMLKAGDNIFPSPDANLYVVDRNPVDPVSVKATKPGSLVLMDSKCREIRTLHTKTKKDLSTYYGFWSPDGKYFAFATDPEKRGYSLSVVVVDVQTGSVAAKFSKPIGGIIPLDWYPDSKAVVCLGQTTSEYIIYKLQLK